MINEQIFLDQTIKSNLKTYMMVFKKLLKVNEMITYLVVCWTTIISKKLIRCKQLIQVNNMHLMSIHKLCKKLI